MLQHDILTPADVEQRRHVVRRVATRDHEDTVGLVESGGSGGRIGSQHAAAAERVERTAEGAQQSDAAPRAGEQHVGHVLALIRK